MKMYAWLSICLFLLWFNVIFKHLRSSQRCLLVAVVTMCCHIWMPCRRHRTWHPVTVYRHRVDLSLCYPLMWNITVEYTTIHSNGLGPVSWSTRSLRVTQLIKRNSKFNILSHRFSMIDFHHSPTNLLHFGTLVMFLTQNIWSLTNVN